MQSVDIIHSIAEYTDLPNYVKMTMLCREMRDHLLKVVSPKIKKRYLTEVVRARPDCLITRTITSIVNRKKTCTVFTIDVHDRIIITEVTTYDVISGKHHGLRLVMRENEDVYEEYHQGHVHGTRCYTMTGRGGTYYLISQISRGLNDGPMTRLDQNGKVIESSIWDKGQMVMRINYYPDESVLSRDNVLTGEYEEYSSSGSLRLHYSPRMKDGSAIVERKEDGVLCERYAAMNGKIHGRYQAFHSNGRIRVDGNYYSGRIVGTEYHYDENGIIVDKKRDRVPKYCNIWRETDSQWWDGLLYPEGEYDEIDENDEFNEFDHRSCRWADDDW